MKNRLWLIAVLGLVGCGGSASSPAEAPVPAAAPPQVTASAAASPSAAFSASPDAEVKADPMKPIDVTADASG
jgi:hypothetical protein